MIDKENPAYVAIEKFYGDQTAKRSGVRLINHINEGLIILEAIGASEVAQEAYCLHPIFQNSPDLVNAVHDEALLASIRPSTIVHVMEYRSVANAYLSKHDPDTVIELSPLAGVNQMLIADKVQNRKDFHAYHFDHQNYKRLDQYFSQWLTALGVSEKQYKLLISLI